MASVPLAGPSEADRRARAVGAITNEHLLWAGVFALALAARTWHLDNWPLTNTEASTALSALAVSRGEPAVLANPFFGWLQAATFAIFGANEISARLWAAVAGAAVCLTPLAFRRTPGASDAFAGGLSPSRALIAGALLAVSPTLIFVSRQSNGAMLTWALALTAWGAWLRGRSRVVLILAGLVLACGTDAGTPMVVVAASAVLGGLRIVRSESETGGRRIAVSYSAPGAQRATPIDLVAGLAAFVVASTGALTHMTGLSEALNGWLQWGRALDTNVLPLNRALIGLVIYEPLVWVFALAGVVWLTLDALRQGKPMERDAAISRAQLAFLAVGILALLVAPTRAADEIVPLVLGGVLLASSALGRLFGDLADRGTASRDGVAACACLIGLFIADIGLRNYAGQGQTLWLTTMLLALAMIALAAVAFGILFDPATGWRGLGSAVVLFLGIYTLSALVQLTQVRHANPAEPYAVDAVPQGLTVAVDEINTVSMRALSDKNALRLQVADTAPPAVRWALRDQRNLRYLPKPNDPEAMLFPESVRLESSVAYVGNAFDFGRTGAIEAARCNRIGERFDCQPLARWFMFRDLPTTNTQRWVFWIRQDIANKASGVR